MKCFDCQKDIWAGLMTNLGYQCLDCSEKSAYNEPMIKAMKDVEPVEAPLGVTLVPLSLTTDYTRIFKSDEESTAKAYIDMLWERMGGVHG